MRLCIVPYGFMYTMRGQGYYYIRVKLIFPYNNVQGPWNHFTYHFNNDCEHLIKLTMLQGYCVSHGPFK